MAKTKHFTRLDSQLSQLKKPYSYIILMLGTARRTKTVSKVADSNPRGSAVRILNQVFKKNFIRLLNDVF
jgi:hypothetical protein